MLEFSDVAVAHAIQLAVAPVFLLTGISAILAVMTNRLGRIIDRARVLEAKLDGAAAEILTGLRADLAILSRRAKLINRAITLCTTTALLVCTVHCNIVPERLFTLRRLALRGAPLYRGNVDFLFCAGVVSAGDLFGHGEPTDQPALNQPG